jgi:hypothetical protein
MHNVPFIVSKSRGQAVYRAAIYGAVGLLGLVLTACGGGGGGGTATPSYTVSATASTGGSISPASVAVNEGATTSLTLIPDNLYGISTASGCGGVLNDNTYTTGAITADCTVTASFVLLPPVLSLTPTAVKSFHFSWVDVEGETGYRLLENPDGVSGYTEVASIAADTTSHDLEVFLPGRINASYMLRVCDAGGCTDHAEVAVSGTLAAAVGYVKASNTQGGDRFYSVAISADGNTLAVGATHEDSAAIGIGGDQSDNTATSSGAVYLFTRIGGLWVQKAYIKASNTGAYDFFGQAVALSDDGSTLAVGAWWEDSDAIGIDGKQSNDNALSSGAVYVFLRGNRDGDVWTQQAYIKASNSEASDRFGYALALSADGNTLAVSSPSEASAAIGIGGDQNDNTATDSGAVYVFTRSTGVWTQQAYIKASSSGANDAFGISVALADDGNTLAVGAGGEDSGTTGVGSTPDETALGAGAVYVFTRSTGVWAQQAYVKASNTEASDQFGYSIALSGDGNTLAGGAYTEDSAAIGIDGDQTDNTADSSGAVYVFTRSTGIWSQQAYVKASNSEAGDNFGISSLALSSDGNMLAVSSPSEASNSLGINGGVTDNSALWSGAAYLFARNGGVWSQQAYIKAPNTEAEDRFGQSVALAGDGSVLAVGAY